MIGFLADLAGWFLENWSGPAGWAHRVWEHIQVSAAAVAAAALVGIPLGSWLGHLGRGGAVVASMVHLGRALPSFGIVALSLPVTIRIAEQVPFIKSGLGFFPTFIALFALALPPIFANTHAGIRSVDPGVVEAARAMGLTGAGTLTAVELPAASPVIIAGLRTATVQVIATATLGALVAYGGLGRFIIDGFAVRDDVQIVAGALLVAVLAVATELAFAFLERRVIPAPLRRLVRPPRRGEPGSVTIPR
jgi:osmoprotectant transport system permease protein